MKDPIPGYDPYAKKNPVTGEGPSSKTGLFVGIGVGIVIVLGIVAVLLANSGGGGDLVEGTGAYAAANTVQEIAPVQIDGDILPPAAQSGVVSAASDPAVGMRFPKMTGQSFDESSVVIDPEDGRAKIVMFLAHWCGHCQAEVPVVQNWLNGDNLPDDVDIYSVSTQVRQDGAFYPPSKWLEREKWEPKVLLDTADARAANAAGLSGTPFFVFVNADGTVAQRASGSLPVAEFTALVEALNTDPGTDAPAADTESNGSAISGDESSTIITDTPSSNDE